MSAHLPAEQIASRKLRHPYLFLLSVVLAPTLWIIFVGSVQVHEMLVGTLASMVTVLFTFFVCRSGKTEVTLRARDLVQLWRIPWYILSDGFQITVVAINDLLRIQPAESHYRVCGFDTSAHDPVRKARTVLAVAYSTASPNSIVLGIESSTSRMLFHQLKVSEVTEMTKALGAKG